MLIRARGSGRVLSVRMRMSYSAFWASGSALQAATIVCDTAIECSIVTVLLGMWTLHRSWWLEELSRSMALPPRQSVCVDSTLGVGVGTVDDYMFPAASFLCHVMSPCRVICALMCSVAI